MQTANLVNQIQTPRILNYADASSVIQQLESKLKTQNNLIAIAIKGSIARKRKDSEILKDAAFMIRQNGRMMEDMIGNLLVTKILKYS